MMGPKNNRASVKPKNFKGSLKKLLKYIKPHLFSVIVVIIFSLTSVVSAMMATLKFRELTNVINEAAVSGMASTLPMSTFLNLELVLNLILTLACFYALNIVLSYFQQFILARVNQRMAQRFRSEISTKINKIPLKYYDKTPFGDTLSRITNDVDQVGQSLSSTVSSLVSSIAQILLVLVFMFIISWQMAFTTMGTLPLNLIVVFVLVKISQKYFIRQQKSLGSVNGIIEESFSGQLIIKLFNAEDRTLKHFNNENTNLQQAHLKSSIFGGFMHPLMNFISKLGYVAVCVVGGILYSKGICSMGDLAAFLLFVNMFQQPIMQISQIINTMQQGLAAAERIFEFLEEDEDEDESNKTTVLDPLTCKGDVEFKNVSFGYNPEKIILHDFSASVKAGQKIAIVGPTGAGKTTLVNLLMRFYNLNSGDILIDGISINDITRTNIRSLFSMVLQDTWLFEGTIRDNLCYNKKNLSQEDLDKVAKAANIYHFIKTLPDGYDTVLSDEVNISSGQKQLFTIARAMIENEPILILDEATSNVDTRTEELIQEAMDNLTVGKTSFVIAHRLSTIKNADVILVLKGGDIVEQGNHETLLKQNGFYASLYNSQFSLTE